MNSFFAQKVVLITGGTSGIGAALVQYLLQYNAKVATCARNIDEKNLECYKTNENFILMQADVSSSEDCKNVVEKTIKKFGNIDILINNAGISMRAEFADLDLQVIEKIMQINFMGTVYCTKFALPHLQNSKGYIVGITSVAGFKATPGRTGYAASKFAMNGFLESLRIELLKKSVKVITVAPGFVASGIRERVLNQDANVEKTELMNENNMMSSQECAVQILNAIYKKRKLKILSLLGKLTVLINKVSPTLTDKFVYKFYYDKHQRLKK